MTRRKLQVTAGQLKRLADDLQGLPLQLEGDHLTAEQFSEYIMWSPTAALPGIEQHLKSCEECASTIEQIFEAAEAARVLEASAVDTAAARAASSKLTPDDEVRARQAVLVAALSVWLATYFIYHRLAIGAKGDMPSEDLRLQSEDKMLGAFVSEEPNGDLLVRLGAKAKELKGVEVCFYAGSWEEDPVPFREPGDEPDRVVAELVIPRETRAELHPNEPLRARLVGVEPGDLRPE